VDESRCILCGICVDACPYDALRDGQDNELSHTSRANPQIDLLALAEVEQETEVTYIERERDWIARATAEGRLQPPTYDEYELPPSLATPTGARGGSGRGAKKP
jgi:formate hydrogenlyase subunit 6/NADH:ubiquinone oxidoreductase subunit I